MGPLNNDIGGFGVMNINGTFLWAAFPLGRFLTLGFNYQQPFPEKHSHE